MGARLLRRLSAFHEGATKLCRVMPSIQRAFGEGDAAMRGRQNQYHSAWLRQMLKASPLVGISSHSQVRTFPVAIRVNAFDARRCAPVIENRFRFFRVSNTENVCMNPSLRKACTVTHPSAARHCASAGTACHQKAGQYKGDFTFRPVTVTNMFNLAAGFTISGFFWITERRRQTPASPANMSGVCAALRLTCGLRVCVRAALSCINAGFFTARGVPAISHTHRRRAALGRDVMRVT